MIISENEKDQIPTFAYRVDRPILWFAKDQVVSREKLLEYFTKEAIKSLLDYGFIKIVPVTEEMKINAKSSI